MKNKYFFIFFIVALLGMFGGVFLYRYFIQTKVIHFHASFQVYIDNTLQDYSNQKYMSLLPCGKAYTDPALEQSEKAHLHSQVGYIVHVHRIGATWGDLFGNMRVSLDKKKPMVTYVNGKQVKNIFSEPIHPYDRALILIGNHGSLSEYLKKQTTISRIMQIEKGTYEACGTSAQ